ncbi:MAG: hypothetical protein WC816_00650 [Sphingomonas sp.]|jgi:hypothetical protein
MRGLPSEVLKVAEAQSALVQRYSHIKLCNGSTLQFTLDGKLVGDLAEAIVAELFDLQLDPSRHIDGCTRCEQKIPVQIKATGRENGSFQFRTSKFPRPDNLRLIAIQINWQEPSYDVVYNGPESKIRSLLEKQNSPTKSLSIKKMREADRGVDSSDRLITKKPDAAI